MTATDNIRDFKRLLVVMTDRHIGNLLVSLYALKRVQQALSENQSLSCIIDSRLMPLATYLLPDIEFLPFALRGGNLPLRHKAGTLIRLLVRLKRRQYDVAVDLYGHSESLWLARWSGADFIAAYSCQPRLTSHYHWTHRNSDKQPQHQVDYYLLPFQPVLGLLQPAQVPAPCLPEVLDRVKVKLAALHRREQQPLVLIHPGAGKPYKFWPTRHWQSLIRQLEDGGYQVLLLGAGEDLAQVEAIMKCDDINPINAYGCFNLIETIHLGFLARLMVGNDSGPVHLLATTPVEVFSLFGPTDHTLWAPLAEHSHILRAGITCLDSCSKQHCQRETTCLQALTPDSVYASIKPFLIAGAAE